MTIQITHTAAEGTLAQGTSKGDGTAAILKPYGFRWSRTISTWYLPQSRDRTPRTDLIRGVVDALLAAGFEATTDIDATPRATADVEADRSERVSTRVQRLDGRSHRLTARGEAEWERTRQLRELIPMGQPVMPDHYSYNRDIRFRDRLHRQEGKAIDTLKEGEEAARRAEAAETHQSYRMTGPVTERRIKDLEAKRRGLQRDLDGYTRNFRNGAGVVVSCDVSEPAQGAFRDRIEAQLSEVEEQLTYWRAHLAELVASGEYRTWGPDDFSKGDHVLVRGDWREVVRVNRKTLTVTTGYSWTDTVPYDKVRGQRGPSRGE